MIDYGEILQVDMTKFRDANPVQLPVPDATSLQEDEVILKIDQFAYTSNNTTYAVVGDQVGYWKFFPVPETPNGVIPCWGFADVEASKHPEIEVGTRYYGYFPMASHLVVKAGRVSPNGFTDVMEHRQALPVIYNQYANCATDPLYRKDMEVFQSIYRPLFMTSFLINDQFEQNNFYHSDQLVLTSASSKTALGLAACLKDKNVSVIGLTSNRNKEMVKASGYYDEVYTYDTITEIKGKSTSYVDFSGNHDMQLNLQQHLGDHLNYVCLVGVVHWEDRKGITPLPKKGEFFFAPTYAVQRIKELGKDVFGKKLAVAYFTFVKDMTSKIEIVHHQGLDALAKLHVAMTDGDINASQGNIVSF